MSKCTIYTTNTSSPTIAIGDIIPVGVTSRRYGHNIKQDGNAITLCGQGYYLINASSTVSPTAAGTVSVTAQKDGVAIIGATGSQTVAANGTANIGITAVVRNACGCDSSILSFVLDGTASVINNLAVTVEKL